MTFKASEPRTASRASPGRPRCGSRPARGRGGAPPQRRGAQAREHLRRRRQVLNSDPPGASIAGVAGAKPTGLERIYDDRLGGRRSSTLRFGDRVIARVAGRAGARSTRRSGSASNTGRRTRSASKLGGIAVISPATARCSRSPGSPSPRPSRRARASRSSPPPPRCSTASRRRAAPIRCARPRRCRASSCATRATSRAAASLIELVRALLQLGLRAAGRQARREAAGRRRPRSFGFNEQPEIPAAKLSTIPKAKDLRTASPSARARSARTRDHATPLGMASVARRSPTGACA